MHKNIALSGRLLGVLLLLLWGLFFLGGMVKYTGSSLVYILFSFVFLAMLLSGLILQSGYGYFFLVVMLWLGFWLKVTVHLMFPYPFTEFTGRFVDSPDAWDEVLIIASVAAAGVLASRGMASGYKFRSTRESECFSVPAWYQIYRAKVWGGLIFTIAMVASLNAIYGFQQSGLVPGYILGWRLNGVIYYLLATSFPIFCATLLWWDFKLNKNLTGVAFVILFEGVASSISLLSRGTLIFHAVPQFFALYRLRTKIVGYTWKQGVIFSMALMISIVFTYSVVNSLRNQLYSNSQPEVSASFFNGDGLSQSANRFLRFAVDRWIGIEGVMAVAAYPEKGVELFWRALNEKSEIGEVTLYQGVCLSHYTQMDAEKFRFASLPGAAAFFFYTGSLVAVFLGLVVFTLIIFAVEELIFFITRNPLLCAFVGGGLANLACQFGVAPSNLTPYFLALSGTVLILWIVQSGEMPEFVIKIKRAIDRVI